MVQCPLPRCSNSTTVPPHSLISGAHDRKCCSRSITLLLRNPRIKDLDETCTLNARRTSVRSEGLCLLMTIAVSATHPAVMQWFVFTLRRHTHLIRAIAQHRELGCVVNCLILAAFVGTQTCTSWNSPAFWWCTPQGSESKVRDTPSHDKTTWR